MRRSQSWLAAVAVLAMGLSAQSGMGAVYNAPYYQSCNQPSVACGNFCNVCGESPATKLGRGVTNAVTGWLEIPKHALTGTFNCNVNPLEGLAVGLIRGTGRAVERTGIGLYEAFTFPLPGFGPLLCPEYVSLEPGCMNWRYGNYYGSTLCQPCIPCNPCGPIGQPARAGMQGGAGGVGAIAPPPPRQESAGSGPAKPMGAGTPSATYPDDYLK